MCESIFIKNGFLVRKYTVAKGDLLIRDGRIEKIGTNLETTEDIADFDASELYVVPGFIDIHCHGGTGADFMDGTIEAVITIANTSLAHGVTTMLGTVMTASIEEMRRAMAAIVDARDERTAGIYVEGPFFSPLKKGAQSPRHLLQPSLQVYESLVDGFKDKIKIFALAPELPGAREVIYRLKEDGIKPSFAHSNATFEETKEAIELGVEHFTHFFNGMRGFHHRDPGAVGAALLTPGVTLELIADGIHVHPEAIKFLVKTKGIDNICLITDAIRATMLEDGEYMLGDQRIRVQQGIARLIEGDSLAGSTLTMDQAVKNMVKFGIPLPDAVRTATLVPARVLGLEHRKGSLEVGKDADLVLLDVDLNVKVVLIRGEVVYRDGKFVKGSKHGK